MIDLFAIERWAMGGGSWLHRTSAPAKLLAAAAIVGVLVVSRDAAALAFLYAALIAALLTARVPVVAVLGLSLLPISMSALFALTRLGTTWESALVIVEKGAITSLTVLLVVSSTPPTQLFAVLRTAMPSTLAEILLLAYRSIFILLGRALAAREAVRLRDASRSWTQRLKRRSMVGALAVLRATELASEQYAAMQLRGFVGRSGVRVSRLWRRSDLRVLAGLAAVLALAVWPGLQTGSPLYLPLSAVVLAVGLGARAWQWRTWL